MEDNKEFSKTCVEFEMEKHPWLSDAQAKRIVEDNLQDDPDFYEFLGEDEIEDEIEEEDLSESYFDQTESSLRSLDEDTDNSEKGKSCGRGKSSGPTLIEISFGLPYSNKD